MMKNKSIVLLSGGLDSVVSLAMVKEFCSDILALTFNYGQKSFLSEKTAAENIAKYYNVKHKIVDLPWLAEISNSALNTEESIPKLSLEDLSKDEIISNASTSVIVPNRNALFINIAACFAETQNYDSIIIGANAEEAKNFIDNSAEFINAINFSLENSLNSVVKVIAPLINISKNEIVKLGIELNIPFDLIHSCYTGDKKHCGECESCMRLKQALKLNEAYDLMEKIF